MPCINNCSFVGTAVREPELRYTPNNTAICTVGMALNSTWKDANGEKRDEVSFIDLDAWGKLGEIVNQYLRKGDKFACTAKVKQETWDDKNGGGKRSKIKFVIQDFMLLGDKRDNQQQQQQPAKQSSQQRPQQQGAFQPVEDSQIPFTHDAFQH